MFNAIIQAYNELGNNPVSNNDLEKKVAKIMKVSASDLKVLHNKQDNDRDTTRFSYNLSWARTYLKKYGILKRIARGKWALTEKGLETSEVDPDKVCRVYKSSIIRLDQKTIELDQFVRIPMNIIIQGNHEFYSCTMPSSILASCCTVSSRVEDPVNGFQRLLDKKRASEIAEYIDQGFGSIPTSIILSAQVEAQLKVVKSGELIEFFTYERAFLILDGQHRVYGFSLAESELQVPVVIYNGLSRKDESRLFIDINDKQRAVPSSLLLDIKQLAEYESSVETFTREIFDHISNSPESVFLNQCSAIGGNGKLTNVTFARAFKPLVEVFKGKDTDEVFEILNNYFKAFKIGFEQMGVLEKQLMNSVVIKAVMRFLPKISARLRDRHGPDWSVDNFHTTMEGMFSKLKPDRINNPGRSYLKLIKYFEDNLESNFHFND